MNYLNTLFSIFDRNRNRNPRKKIIDFINLGKVTKKIIHPIQRKKIYLNYNRGLDIKRTIK